MNPDTNPPPKQTWSSSLGQTVAAGPAVSSAASAPPPPSRPPSFSSSRGRLIIGAVIVLIIIGGGIWLLTHRSHPKATTPSTTSGPATPPDQSLNADTFKDLLDQNSLTGSGQSLVFASSVLFKNDATFDGTTTMDGNLITETGFTALSGINVSGGSSLDTLGIRKNLTVVGTSSLQGNVEAKQQLTVDGGLNVVGSANFTNIAVTGNLSIAGTLSVNNLTANGQLTVNGHIVTTGSTPSIQTGGALGGGSTTMNGNDASGSVTLDSGGAPFAGEMAIITFTKPYTSIPNVVITPVGATASRLQYYVTRTPTFFSIETSNTPSTSTAYNFDYIIVQ